MSRPRVLIFHESGLFYGSTEKLLQFLGKQLTKKYEVFFAYSPQLGEFLKSEVEAMGMRLIPFSFSDKDNREPFAIHGMRPSLAGILQTYAIQCVFTVVHAHYQFPINRIPASIPIILVSPFGHYCTNGNVQRVYVSGRENVQRLEKRGVRNAQMLFNPLEDFSPEILNKAPIGQVVTFGRIGRGDDGIYDPISVKAFKKLEDKYGQRVRYVVVNPPPQWKKDAAALGIKNMDYRPSLSQAELPQFYKEIDIFAHARSDGETIGIAIGEAMMAGNPIISHISHYHNEHLFLLDTAYARWAELDNSDQYFEHMVWFVEHANQIRAMGQLARMRALSIFGLDVQLPKIFEDFKQALTHYHHATILGKMYGYSKLWLENGKAVPFLMGKYIARKVPGFAKLGRKIYGV